MRVLLAGATGYIGRAVLSELLACGHDVVALVREPPAGDFPEHSRLTVCLGDWVQQPLSERPPGDFDAVVSCIASRTGGPLDAWYVDYFANLRLLDIAQDAGARRFVLLSAICVQKPRLAFQREKLRFEAALARSGMDFTIVRPTAFFKSLSGQIKRVRSGRPFLVFGDGLLTACKPISERDLARFLVATLEDSGAANQVLPIGGPGDALTPIDQANMLVRLFGPDTGTRQVSPKLFDVLGAAVAPASWISQWGQDRREFLRIAKYYATESMLFWDATRQVYDADLTPSTGSDTLEAFYTRIRDGEIPVPGLGDSALFS